ncbi:DUF1648 domain-containing protein [Clostridium fungisolvens]|uniref:DUF1648 domain-containing protein n=1 Tax=Clostridium fungisolvens TaxID=1604897 RepID=A0A6V8SHF2_9CLOT|nr:DUF5808 domain-containing protein [Clostridium fungisolvens]GFP74568.1 hypothetical protein bsdtw1_00623 [Clostridium fungisolvens]
MNDLFIMNLMSTLVIGLLYITFLLTPKMTRKDIIFGIVIPLDRTKDKEIDAATKSYYVDITIFTAVMAVLYFIVVNIIFTNPATLVAVVFIIIFGYFLIFLKANNRVKVYKAQNNLLANKKQMVYVNTEMSQKLRNTAVISSYWFIIPAIIAVSNLILPLMKYDQLPSKIGIHWNIYGVADNFVEKSVGSVITNGMVTVILVGILAFVNYSIAISKNKIDAAQPMSSSQKLYKFKRFNSIMIFSLSLLLSSLITLFNLNSLNIVSVDLGKLTPVLIVAFVLIIFVPIFLTFKLGQGGSNLKTQTNEDVDNTVSNIDDDIFWKLGSIYYNPNDPSLFVEKRFGVGWTLNFGNKIAIVISVGLVILILAMSIFPLIFS